MVWGWPKLLQLFPFGVALVKPGQGREAADCCQMQFCHTPLLWAGSLLRQGSCLKGSLVGLYFPLKAINKPPALHCLGLSENIWWPDALLYILLIQPEGRDGPEDAIRQENEKQAKLLANLASEKEIGRENRKTITSEHPVTPYSKLVHLLGKSQVNLFVVQLKGLLKVVCHHWSCNFLIWRRLCFHLLKSSLKWNDPSWIRCLGLSSGQTLVLEIWRKRSRFIKVSRCLSSCRNPQVA